MPLRFNEHPPAAVLAEIVRLEGDGYFIHREWANGFELRKKSRVSNTGLLARSLLTIAIPVIFLPLFGRTILDKVFGFKYRVFVTRDSVAPQVLLR